MASDMGRVIVLWDLRRLSYHLSRYDADGCRTLISIPIAAELQAAAGTTAFVAFCGGMLVLALLSFIVARWACLDYKWRGKVKI